MTDPERISERERIKQLIADLEQNGVNVYAISKRCHRGFNTVKHWKETGRVDSYDAKLLDELHAYYCCSSHCETLTNSSSMISHGSV